MRKQILNRLSSLGLLAEADAVEQILKSKNPLSFCDTLADHKTDVLTKKDVLEVEKGTRKKTTRPRSSGARAEDLDLSVVVKESYSSRRKKASVQEFVTYFNDRYEGLSPIIKGRPGMHDAISITHANTVGDKVSIIGIVVNKRTTKNGHTMLELEDPTGRTPVLVGKFKPDLLKQADGVVLDEVIGIKGNVGDGIIFCNEIVWPDVPIRREAKEHGDVAVAFLSDTHFGSKECMEKNFLKMVSWLNGEKGTPKQRELARKVGYVLIAGDVIDGVGIYPGQERDLTILDIDKQFRKAAEYFEQIPDHIQLVISPGNHDAIRLPQPQPPLDEITDAFGADNITLVSNPALVQLHNSLDVLLYHGASFNGMISSVPRLFDGYSQPSLVMEELLKRRHLSPTYGMDIAAEERDYMVIKGIPDLIHSGHVHANGQSKYRGIQIINSGSWQSQTSFQKMVGINPTPCKLPILELGENKLQIIDFQ